MDPEVCWNDKLVFESVNFFLKTLPYIFSHKFLVKGQKHKRIFGSVTLFHLTTVLSSKFYQKSFFTIPKWPLKSTENTKTGWINSIWDFKIDKYVKHHFIHMHFCRVQWLGPWPRTWEVQGSTHALGMPAWVTNATM